MKRHALIMVIGCGVPLLLIFFAPALGIEGSLTTFLFIAVCVGAHLFMMRGHTGDHEDPAGQHAGHSQSTGRKS